MAESDQTALHRFELGALAETSESTCSCDQVGKILHSGGAIGQTWEQVEAFAELFLEIVSVGFVVKNCRVDLLLSILEEFFPPLSAASDF